MGKEDKEDSGFGFKDRAKAEETIKLLEKHDLGYRRLTVRGLLGRAKRVLSVTKAEDKIKNIKEAIEVFEKWTSDLEKNKEKKEGTKNKGKESPNENEDKSDSDVEMAEKPPKKEVPVDKVQGLGFKDKQAAENTIKELEGRDPDYQQLAVKGLLGSSKRVLTTTRDETKISNIKAAVATLEKYLEDFESEHRMKQNNPYVSLGFVRTARKLAEEDVSESQKSFISAYESVNGEYKRLRTVPSANGKKSWDIVRNAELSVLKKKFADSKLFNDKDSPTKEHLQYLLWAYSPEQAKVKKVMKETKEESPADSSRKRKSSGAGDVTPNKKNKE